ncbi:hypothetical protein CH296_01140 [Rhodococcus sp. 14-2496-1d]|uniref:hypothetical protein n=1 Tax=Rhodococcus sp. 14-2496-1d TaxID=2023146 RepID=UPI000B9BF300|nr:hypothetical protein [Rhodococcus sp. 14-2496-1d]OZF39940.1 hypothetical protein CH296_01140 [Rhodococcus sp. 14-2496-1d]
MDLEQITESSLIPPDELKRFLGANRWAIVEDKDSEWEIWKAPEDVPATAVTLIFDDEYFDYETRLFEANQAIRKVYELTSVALAEKVAALSADLFFFRISQFSRDGTIPFRQAQRALDGIATMVKAAATTTSNPNHSHQGRRPAEVESFIADKLRLGHTKKGSFVVTAVARFDDETPNTEVKAGSKNDEILPYGRRVMTTLARGLDAVRGVASGGEPIGSAVERGVSLELVEALEKITDEEGLQTIEVSFDWSPSVIQSVENPLPNIVTFEQEQILALPQVAEQLTTRKMPTVVEIVGPVLALSRAVNGGEPEESGAVTVLGEVDGQMRKIVVELEGREHDWAIRAYRERFPIILSGELVKRGSWRLEGYVTLDIESARYLASRSRSSKSPEQGELEPPAADDNPDTE